MNVALFTHCFLEPTHFAIGQLVDALGMATFHVYARRFGELPNALGSRNVATRELISLVRYRDDALAHCDVVHAIFDGDTTFEALEMAQRQGLPFVLSFHGGFDTNAKIYDHRYRSSTVAACRTAVAVTVTSETDRKRLAHLGVSKNVHVLPVAVDLSRLPSEVQDRAPKDLILVARFVAKKGIDIALRTLAELPKDFCLTVVGDGELRTELVTLAELLGLEKRVTWTGLLPLERTLELVGQACALLHPSCVAADGNADGTPQIILWAQALGTPVVATSTGSISDIVSHKETGMLANVDPRALAAAVIELVSDAQLRAAIAERGLKLVRDNHRLEEVAAQLGRLYCRIARYPHGGNTDGLIPRSRTTEAALSEAANRLGLPVGVFRFAGKGGHGQVFVAPHDGGLAAVKVPAYESHSEEAWPLLRHKLLREWEVLSEARGEGLPGPIAVHAEGQFLIRDFIAGEPLSRAARYVTPTARALLFVDVLRLARQLFPRFHGNSRGTFLIRDFKPQNLILALEGRRRLCLIDLGAVCDVEQISRRSWTLARLGSGQWRHWAPEQLLAQAAAIGPAVDFFALGVTAFYALTGRWPYSNLCGTPEKVLSTYRSEHLVAVDSLEAVGATAVDRELIRLVASYLEPDAELRGRCFPSAAHLAAVAEEPATASLFGSPP